MGWIDPNWVIKQSNAIELVKRAQLSLNRFLELKWHEASNGNKKIPETVSNHSVALVDGHLLVRHWSWRREIDPEAMAKELSRFRLILPKWYLTLVLAPRSLGCHNSLTYHPQPSHYRESGMPSS